MSTATVVDNRLDPAFVRLALVLLTGVLAVVFDTTIVNIALDTLGRDLHTVLQGIGGGLMLPVAAGLGGRALVDVGLFGSPTFSAATVLNFLSGFVLYGAMLLVPLYLQQLRGEDAITAGLLLAPQGIGVLLSRGLAGSLTDRFGARWVAFTGIAVVALATLPLAFVDARTGVWYLAGVLVVRGVGLGAVTIPVMTAAYQGLPRDRIPHASIATRTAQQLGGSFGTAVLAVILTRETARHADLVTGFDTAFWWALGFTVLAAVAALWLPARPPAGG